MKSNLLQVRHKLSVSAGYLQKIKVTKIETRRKRCVNLFKIWCILENSDQLTRAHLCSETESSEGLLYPFECGDIRDQGNGTVMLEAQALEDGEFKLL